MGLMDSLNGLQGIQGFKGNNMFPESLQDLSSMAQKGLGSASEKISGFGDVAADTLRGGVQSVRGMISDDPSIDVESGRKPEEQMQQQTVTERLVLFLMTFAAGGVMIALSVAFLPLIVVKPAKFALSFTFGNVLAVVSTWFLVGPRAQIRGMFDPVRAWAAALYVGSLVFTLIAVFLNTKLRYILVLVAVVGEVTALIWYALSYIPYGRAAISRLIGLITSGTISV